MFEQDGTQDGEIVSNLIKKSQVVLCVAIGLIASLSIDVRQDEPQSMTFKLPTLMLKDAYLLQMKLAHIILQKMHREDRMTNEYAIEL